MIGLDTGYFLRLLKGDAEASRIWTAIIDGEEAAVSCLTLFELARLARKGASDTTYPLLSPRRISPAASACMRWMR